MARKKATIDPYFRELDNESVASVVVFIYKTQKETNLPVRYLTIKNEICIVRKIMSEKHLTTILGMLFEKELLERREENRKKVFYSINPNLRNQIPPFFVRSSDRQILSSYSQKEIVVDQKVRAYGLDHETFDKPASQLFFHGVGVSDIFPIKEDEVIVILPDSMTNSKLIIGKIYKQVHEISNRKVSIMSRSQPLSGILPVLRNLLYRTAEISKENRAGELKKYYETYTSQEKVISSFLGRNEEILLHFLSKKNWDRESILENLKRPIIGTRIDDSNYTPTWHGKDITEPFLKELQELNIEEREKIANFFVSVTQKCKPLPQKISLVAHSLDPIFEKSDYIDKHAKTFMDNIDKQL
ncbi:MAG: hypothetical protein V1776_03860 [Candidatus Diapherotrites archaeon]